MSKELSWENYKAEFEALRFLCAFCLNQETFNGVTKIYTECTSSDLKGLLRSQDSIRVVLGFKTSFSLSYFYIWDWKTRQFEFCFLCDSGFLSVSAYDAKSIFFPFFFYITSIFFAHIFITLLLYSSQLQYFLPYPVGRKMEHIPRGSKLGVWGSYLILIFLATKAETSSLRCSYKQSVVLIWGWSFGRGLNQGAIISPIIILIGDSCQIC